MLEQLPLRRVAKLTGMNPEHLRQLCKAGKIKGKQRGSGVWVTTVADVISYQLRGLSKEMKIRTDDDTITIFIR